MMEDYEHITQLYNSTLQKGQEEKATYDDNINQLQEVIQTQEQAMAEQTAVMKYLEKSKGSAT
jgi:hypothetical protein